jgi:hypothetical protein
VDGRIEVDQTKTFVGITYRTKNLFSGNPWDGRPHVVVPPTSLVLTCPYFTTTLIIAGFDWAELAGGNLFFLTPAACGSWYNEKSIYTTVHEK